MLKGLAAVGVVVCAMMPLSLRLPAGTPSFALRALTPEQDSLPSGCTLSGPPSSSLQGGKERLELWRGIGASVNPWYGTDSRLLAAVRERMYGPVVGPDGPPLNRVEAARYVLQAVEDIEVGYAAFYHGGPTLRASVYALRFKNTVHAPEPAGHTHVSSRGAFRWFRYRNTIILVAGDDGTCSEFIGTHVASVVGAQPDG